MKERSGAASRPVNNVTRADVARHAGVSTAVVSYVINSGPRPVAEATAARVRDAIAHLGYRPNSTARALALGSTKTLGLVVPDGSNPFYAEYTVELQRAAAARGHALLITTNSGFDPDVELRSMLELCDRQIDGLVLARGAGNGGVAELARRGIRTPVVIIDSAAPFPGYATVGPDAVGGVTAAVDHLLRIHQHASVGLVMGDSADTATDGRETGWLQAHARSQRLPGGVTRAAFSREGGYEAGLRLLPHLGRPSAIVTSSDLQAIGLLRAAHELGVRVPSDLAVVSFDGTTETQYCWPTLTTVRQPTRAMAEAAVDTLLRRGQQADHQTFAMTLMVRASCGC